MRNAKPSSQPSISITPLPRQASGSPGNMTAQQKQQAGGGKTSFVICEICDGYIKVLYKTSCKQIKLIAHRIL